MREFICCILLMFLTSCLKEILGLWKLEEIVLTRIIIIKKYFLND